MEADVKRKMIKHLVIKIREVGLKNCIVGVMKREKYKKLQKQYQFDEWHIGPYELREYVQSVKKYIEDKEADVVVDIGCGLGELLRHLSGVKSRIGYDESKEVIQAAEILRGGQNISYCVGSFNHVNLKEEIDFLVTLNFMHGSKEDIWKSAYHTVASSNHIKNIVVDVVTSHDGNSYMLDFTKILPEEYKLVDRMGPFLGGRYIEIYSKES